MLALLSAWVGLGSLVLAAMMVIHREWFTDLVLTVTLYSAIFSLTFAGMTLWDLRKQEADAPGIRPRRLQCRVGIGLSLAAIAIVYTLVVRLASRPH